MKNTFPRGLRLDGLKVVVDCANGAAYKTAPSILWELGADVITLGVEPTGININDHCGSQHPEALCEAVLAHGADIGIALDGDADRVVLCDERGRLIDGDQVLGLIARSWKRRGGLAHDTVVATVMSNLGLEKFLEAEGLKLEARRSVTATWLRGCAAGYSLGGEQSGHIVLGTHSTTGDGTVAALQVLAELVLSARPASETLRVFEPLPAGPAQCPAGRQGHRQPHAASGAGDGRCRRLARPPRELRPHPAPEVGHRTLIRVMVEAEDERLVEAIVSDLCSILKGPPLCQLRLDGITEEYNETSRSTRGRGHSGGGIGHAHEVGPAKNTPSGSRTAHGGPRRGDR